MLCIQSFHNDPFCNLATEEYLLKNTGEEVFMLWQSNPVVVIGKHQNTLAEINYRFLREKGIPVARRLTGGGTVYHDPGNINFTFIRKGESGKLVDFEGFISPVIDFLKFTGIDAIRGPKHEILVQGKKVSGNAEHVFRNRVLHHGTLLYSADLNNLRESVRPGAGKFIDRAVRSNRSSVMNLSDGLGPAPDILEFMADFFREIVMRFKGDLYTPSKDEATAIQELVQRKYMTWEWIYGWSPDYAYQNVLQGPAMDLHIELKTHRGIITQCSLNSGTFSGQMLEALVASIENTPHEEKNIRGKLTACGFREMVSQSDFNDLAFAFFG